MNPKFWWYVVRATGLVSWALATASVVWGLALSSRMMRGARPKPAWWLDLHRFLGGLSVLFLVPHIGALLLDGYAKFQVAWVVVPFVSRWRPLAVAMGVVAAWMLLAVEITSLLRRRLSARSWRAVHFLSFGVFVLATAHALTAGSDVTNRVVVAVALVLGAGVWFLGSYRLLARRRPSAAVRPATAPPPLPARQ